MVISALTLDAYNGLIPTKPRDGLYIVFEN